MLGAALFDMLQNDSKKRSSNYAKKKNKVTT